MDLPEVEPQAQEVFDIPRLTDGELVLKPFELGDAADHLAGDDDQQARWLGGKSTEASVRGWILRNKEHWKNDGPVYNFSVRDAAGRLIGMVEANTNYQALRGVDEGDANISYAIYPQARRKGYASRAVTLLETFLAGRGMRRSVIRVPPENMASLGVPRRLGYEDTGKITAEDGEDVRVFVKDLQK
jgi:RimJ/RimL family protein N-acetyltransferase